jgi:hypothetical protein
MVRELEVLFGLHTVACKLRIARHALVFFEQLGGVAALAIVLAIAWLSTEIAGTSAALPTSTASAAALTIIDQMPTSLRSVSKPLRLRQAGLRPRGDSSDPLVPVLAPGAKRTADSVGVGTGALVS